MPEIDVDIGPMPLEHAETLRLCVANCINNGNLWESDNRKRAVSLKAMLDFKIAMAKKEAAAFASAMNPAEEAP